MKLGTLRIIIGNLSELGIETLSIEQLNNIGEFLAERNITNIKDAKIAVEQYLASHK